MATQNGLELMLKHTDLNNQYVDRPKPEITDLEQVLIDIIVVSATFTESSNLPGAPE